MSSKQSHVGLLTARWLEKSLEMGFWVSESEYEIEGDTVCSEKRVRRKKHKVGALMSASAHG